MINDILNEADSKMDKSVESTREDFVAIRAGRANPSTSRKVEAGLMLPQYLLRTFW